MNLMLPYHREKTFYRLALRPWYLLNTKLVQDIIKKHHYKPYRKKYWNFVLDNVAIGTRD